MRCAGFSLQGLLLLGSSGSKIQGVGSGVVAHGIFLEQRWNPSPALAGGFFPTEPPGKPSLLCKQLLSLLEPPWLTAFSNRQPGRPCRLRSPVQAQASGCASGSSEEHSPTGGRWRAGHPGCRPHRSSGRNCLSQGPPSRSHVASG